MVEKLGLENFDDWLAGGRPFYFFGPCSAESYEQLQVTAQGISENFKNVIFRAGVWKPRTRPNSFEGIGVNALQWLQDIKSEFGFKITTEVANAAHVEACLKAGVDVLWIGARSTVNPFSIQAIADSLKGVDIPVFVKNPINPDLALWKGALERFNKAGITKLGAIHRGFHMTENGPYRNYPNWNLAVQLKATYPDLPLICDVSHIAGNPELIPHVAQKAIDLDMDGLMVETHYNPKVALSDSKQQLTPSQLKQLISGLTTKNKYSSDAEFKSQLEDMREKINQIDAEIIERMAERMNIAQKIGVYKRKNNVTVLQIEHWKETLDKCHAAGIALGLSDKFIDDLLNSMHDESIRKQTTSSD